MDQATIASITAKLNAVVDDLQKCFAEHNIPRLRATHHIGLARSNGRPVTAQQLREEGWHAPDELAARLNVIAAKLDDLGEMSRARAIKLLNGGSRYFDKDTNREVSRVGDPTMAPNEITEDMVANWAEAMEAVQ